MATNSSVSNGTLIELEILRGRERKDPETLRRIPSLTKVKKENITERNHTSTQKCFLKKKTSFVSIATRKATQLQIVQKRRKKNQRKKMSYRNKKGKVNFFDLPSSCDELLSFDSETENELNHVYSDTSFNEERCRDPHCTECRDCDCSDPYICNCNAVRMMRTDDDEISRNLLKQMMVATDPQIKEMYKSLLTDHLTKIPSSSKKSPNKGYVPPASLFSVEDLTQQFRKEDFGEDLPQTLPGIHQAIKELRKDNKREQEIMHRVSQRIERKVDECARSLILTKS